MRTARNLLVDGEVQICGNPISRESFVQMSAYVQQEDLFIASLTVREQLIFQVKYFTHPHGKIITKKSEILTNNSFGQMLCLKNYLQG